MIADMILPICRLNSSVILACLVMASGFKPPHPNHVTLTEIEFNDNTGKFEVSLCVWPEDLESVLKKIHDEKFPSKEFRMDDRTVAKWFPQYLNSHFIFSADRAAKKSQFPIRWVGSELGTKKAWLYFEIQPKSIERLCSIKNMIFFELNDDQINHVKCKNGDQLTWHQLTKQEPTAVVSILDD